MPEAWTIYNTSQSWPNSYKGCAVQRAAPSALTHGPGERFEGQQKQMITYPKRPDSGFM